MAQAFDIERCLLEVKTRLYDRTEGLNAQLTAIDAEKATTDMADYNQIGRAHV